MKSDIFKGELELIRDTELRNFIRGYLDECVPSYFWVVPASSSGKYHPEYALGVGGLVRHTKGAVLLAEDLLSLEQNITLKKAYHDEIISALIVHDTFKQGINEGHTVFNHPVLSAKYLISYAGAKGITNGELHDRIVEISFMVATHMGQWNTSKRSVAVLPKPRTDADRFVHMCDYLASRKYLTVDVDYYGSSETKETPT